MFFEASKRIKAQISGTKKKREKPLLVVEPTGLKNLFIDCAPWVILGKNKS